LLWLPLLLIVPLLFQILGLLDGPVDMRFLQVAPKKIVLSLLLWLSLNLVVTTTAIAFEASDVERLHRTNACEYCDLSNANLAAIKLIGADISGANLTGSNLSGTDLTGAYAVGANFTGANLQKAKLQKADFTGANLTGADLRFAHVGWTKFEGANLSNAKMQDAIVSNNTRFSASTVVGIDILKLPAADCLECKSWEEMRRYCLQPDKYRGWVNVSRCVVRKKNWMWKY